MDKFLLTDSSGEKSVTVTIFVIGSILVMAKLAVSGLTIGELTFPEFTGPDFATAIGALGAVYVMRRHKSVNTGKEEEKVER